MMTRKTMTRNREILPSHLIQTQICRYLRVDTEEARRVYEKSEQKRREKSVGDLYRRRRRKRNSANGRSGGGGGGGGGIKSSIDVTQENNTNTRI